ncbi:MAG: EamA family transporter [Cytophagales bacterium]|nr:EamA family transporter [Cytophagales bacterium]MDW8383165.1 EamA family transporter [Flammeovirgaceae bacterium]
MMNRILDKFWLGVSLFLIYVAWGFPFLAYKVTFNYISPIMLSALRSIVAGLSVVILMVFFPSLRKTKIDWKHDIVAGFWFIVVSINVIVWSLNYIPSGIAALLTSSIPIWVYCIQKIQRTAVSNVWIVLGLLMGFVGIFTLVAQQMYFSYDVMTLIGCAGVCIGNIAWGWAVLHVQKRKDNTNPIVSTGIQFLFGGIVSVPIAFLLEDVKLILPFSYSATLGFTFLSFVDVILCFSAYNYALQRLEPVLVTLHAYINPIIAMIVGWYFLNERINWQVFLGSALILLSIYLIEKGYRKKTDSQPYV